MKKKIRIICTGFIVVIVFLIIYEKNTRQLFTPEVNEHLLLSHSSFRNYKSESKTVVYDSATEYILYKDKEKEFELNVPFNPKWGTKHYRIEPIYFSKKGPSIQFGRLVTAEGGFGREFGLSVVPVRTSAEVFAEYNRPPWSIATEKESNGLKIVSIDVNEGYGGSFVEIIGKSFNYQLGYCSDTQPSCLDEVLKNFKLVD